MYIKYTYNILQNVRHNIDSLKFTDLQRIGKMSGAEEIKCTGWAALEPKQALIKHEFIRAPLGPNDCEIDVIVVAFAIVIFI